MSLGGCGGPQWRWYVGSGRSDLSFQHWAGHGIKHWQQQPSGNHFMACSHISMNLFGLLHDILWHLQVFIVPFLDIKRFFATCCIISLLLLLSRIGRSFFSSAQFNYKYRRTIKKYLGTKTYNNTRSSTVFTPGTGDVRSNYNYTRPKLYTV